MSFTLSNKKVSKVHVIIAFTILYIVWGSTYLAIAIAIKSIPPFLMAGMRFSTAGLLLFSWSIIQKHTVPDIKSCFHISVSGILLLVCGTGGLAWSEQYLPTGLASIIVATLPLWLLILDKRQWSFHFSNKWVIIGLLVGFAGVILLFSDKTALSFSDGKMKAVSFFILITGTICWAIGSLYSKYTPVKAGAVMKAAIQMLAAGIVSTLIGLLLGEGRHFNINNITQQSILAVVYLITMGSLAGYMSFVWLLEVRPPALVGTYAYVNPVVAVFLGWLIASENTSKVQIVALFIVLTGVILVNFSKEKSKAS